MGKRFSSNWCLQAICLVVVSVVLGLVVNAARPVPVPLDEQPAFEKLPDMPLALAYKSLESGDCLFLDARPAEFYERGHILNAWSLPLKTPEVKVKAALPLPNPWRKIIVYCEDENCDAADAMARRLKRMGYNWVFVLEGGWRAWTQAQMPTQ